MDIVRSISSFFEILYYILGALVFYGVLFLLLNFSMNMIFYIGLRNGYLLGWVLGFFLLSLTMVWIYFGNRWMWNVKVKRGEKAMVVFETGAED